MNLPNDPRRRSRPSLPQHRKFLVQSRLGLLAVLLTVPMLTDAGPLDILRADARVPEEQKRIGAWTVRNAPAPDYGESKYGVRLVDVRMETTASPPTGASAGTERDAPRLVLQCPGRPRRDSKPAAAFPVIEQPARIHTAFCGAEECWDRLAVLAAVSGSGGPESKPVRWPFYTEQWNREAETTPEQHRLEALTTNAPRKWEQLELISKLFVNRVYNLDKTGRIDFSFYEYAELSPAEIDAVMKPQSGRLGLDFDRARFDKNTVGKTPRLVVSFPTQGAQEAVELLEARCKQAATLNAERLTKIRHAVDQEQTAAEKARK